MMTIDINSVGETRRALIAAGYRPVPVLTNQKRPQGFAWTKAARSGAVEPVLATSMNTGILCDGLRVIDIDIDDENVCAAIHDLAISMFGETPTRYRDNSARVALLYRAAEGEPHKLAVTGDLGKVEILGFGQQFVAYGGHPSGAELQWRPHEPHMTARDDLPPIDEAGAAAFLEACRPIIGARATEQRPMTFRQPVSAPTETPIEEVEELLTYIPATCGYHEWVEILMAIHAETGGSQEGYQIADQWSSTGASYKGSKEVWEKWRSFKSGGVSGRTIAQRARENGADLSAIAIKHKAIADYDVEEAKMVADMLLASAMRKEGEERAQTTANMIKELEWFDEVRPVIEAPYIVKRFLDHGAMSVVYGPSNSGKTFFALDLAFHISIMDQWRDRKVRGGGVLYLAAEGGNGIANRIAALRETLGVVDVPFALRRAGLDLLNPKADVMHVIALAAEVQKRAGLALIVVDTLSRVIAGGDENSAVDMTAFIKNIDYIRHQTGAHVMVIHHTGKDAAKGARGHSSLRAATDTEVEVSIDEVGQRLAKVTKQRDYDGGEEFAFSLVPVHLGQDADGDTVSSCIVQSAEKPEKTQTGEPLPPMATCKSILEEIRSAWEDKNPYSTATQSKRTGRYAPKALGDKFGIKYGSMHRVLESWLNNAVIKMEQIDQRNRRFGLKVIGNL